MIEIYLRKKFSLFLLLKSICHFVKEIKKKLIKHELLHLH
jgi:hypothetical protein